MSYQWPGNCMRVCHAHTFSAPCACALFVLQFCRKPRVCYLSHFRQCLFDPHATSNTWLQAIQVAIPNQRMKIQSTCCPAKGNPKNQTFQDPPELPKMWTHQHHITTSPLILQVVEEPQQKQSSSFLATIHEILSIAWARCSIAFLT